MVGFGEPRVVKAGVVGGSYFDVMGLRPVLGRLLDAADDGPDAAGAAVLTHRFWSTSLDRDPSVVGKTIRLGSRSATVVGVLEPSVPYPADTEIIANVVTSPHHLGATMVTQRTHRMTELFGRLAPGATLEDGARRADRGARRDDARAPRGVLGERGHAAERHAAARSDHRAGADRSCSCCSPPPGVVFVIACSNVANLILARAVRRESELAVRAALGASTGALRRTLLAESLVLCGAGAVLGVLLARPLVSRRRPLCRALLGARARRHGGREPAVGRRRPGDGRGRRARLRPAAAVAARAAPALGASATRGGASDHAGHQPPPARVRRHADRALVRAARRRGHAPRRARRAADGEHRLRHAAGAGARRADADRGLRAEGDRLLRGSDAAHRAAAGRGARRGRELRAVARRRHASVPASSSPSRATRPRTAKRTRTRGCATSRPASSRRSASRSSPAATSPTTTGAAASSS